VELNFKSLASQISVFFLLLGINIIIFTSISGLTAKLFFGTDNLYTAESLRYISSLAQVGFFGLTAFECAFLFSEKKPANYLQLNAGVSVLNCLFLILIAILSLPILSHIIAWNEGIKLPQFMSSIETWMRGKEDATAELTSILLSGKSIKILFINLAVIAVIPAVCEEFLFRGCIITWLKKQFCNKHIAIFLSALLFSAIHLQFYGFVPRFLLGLYLGYLFIWTGSLWACVIAHFINNAMTVVVAYLYNNQLINTEYQQFGNVEDNYLLIGLSVLFTSACIFLLYRKRRERYNK
jgi:membrane protease YdiL (CAAX protease family)